MLYTSKTTTMNNSKKIPNDMRANLQQKAKKLRRNQDATMAQEQNIFDNKEQAIKEPVQQQVIEKDEYVANDSEADSTEEMNNISPSNEKNIQYNYPLPNGTFITYQREIEGQEVTTTYRVERVIKSGSFGITYKVTLAIHEHIQCFVLKEFYPRNSVRFLDSLHINLDYSNKDIKESLESFKKEPERINALVKEYQAEDWNSLNLVIPNTGVFEDRGNYYYVMNYVDGTSLYDYLVDLPDYNVLSVSDRLSIVKQLCNAVRNMHSVGCVHQDISPMNVMVNPKKKQVVLIDYGMCTSLIKKGSRYSMVKYGGTEGFWDIIHYNDYVYNPKILKLWDIYSTGAILAYTCLEQNPKQIREGFLWDLCNKKEVKETDTLVEKKYKTIYNMIIDLVKCSTERNLTNRIQTIEEFETQLDAIIDRENHFFDDVDSSKPESTDEDELIPYDESVNLQEEAHKQQLEEEKRKKEAEEKRKKEEEEKRREERQKEVHKKRKEETKRNIIKYVSGLLAGGMIIALVVWGLNEWIQHPILPDPEPKVETPTSDLDADANISLPPVKENLMDKPLANLGKLSNDQMMAVLERAQQDLDFRHQLEHYCHRDLTILQLDQNGVPFKTTIQQLFMNNELGKEYEVSETEIVDHKLKRIILTKK